MVTKVEECIMQGEGLLGRVRVPGVNWNSRVQIRATGGKNSGGLLHFKSPWLIEATLNSVFSVSALWQHRSRALPRVEGGRQIAFPPPGVTPELFKLSIRADKKAEAAERCCSCSCWCFRELFKLLNVLWCLSPRGGQMVNHTSHLSASQQKHYDPAQWGICFMRLLNVPRAIRRSDLGGRSFE